MLRTLHLENFKSFLNETIELGAVTLLTGLNGGGKSSVMQALLALRQSHVKGMLGPSAWQLALNGEDVRLGAGRDVFNMFGNQPEVITIGLTYGDGAAGEWSFNYAAELDVLSESKRLPADASIWTRPPFSSAHRKSLQDRVTEYVSADRLGPRAAFELADYEIGARGVGALGEFAVHFLTAFGTDVIPIPELARQPLEGVPANLQLIHQVEAWLDVISPGVRLAVRADRSLDLAQLTYTFAAGALGETNPFRPTNVGYGLTYALPLLTALLAAPPGSLLLFENPEAHLHPRGHFEFAYLMARAAARGVQIILESHSDHILNGLRVAVSDGRIAPDDVRVHFFRREGEMPVTRVQELRMDRGGGMEDWPEAFFDQWDIALMKLLGG